MADLTNTWIQVADADTYFLTRVGASRFWNEELPMPEKEAALVTAYNMLLASDFSFPETATQNMKNAQCEMALFLLIHQEDMDRRGGLQAQGVVGAGIVQENYDKDLMQEIPIPAMVKQMLSAYETGTNIKVVEVTRDDDEEGIGV